MLYIVPIIYYLNKLLQYKFFRNKESNDYIDI